MKLVLLALAALSVTASANTKDEINHLLSFVKDTNCTYERNGKKHSGPEAVEHIQKKYDYFVEDILTTEDFIQYAATKSKMSGEYYLVHCPLQPTVKSKDWLMKELVNYRNNQL